MKEVLALQLIVVGKTHSSFEDLQNLLNSQTNQHHEQPAAVLMLLREELLVEQF